MQSEANCMTLIFISKYHWKQTLDQERNLHNWISIQAMCIWPGQQVIQNEVS